MAAKSGAGASVSSGASFQARIGAYVLTASICGTEVELIGGKSVKSISFESTEAVDDINIHIDQGKTTYVQAKAKIDYSPNLSGELRSVLDQFEKQSRAGSLTDRYVLATSSRSSRKIVFDMRSGLEAFRAGDEARFRKDQPKALVDIINDLLRIFAELRATAGVATDREACAAIVRRMYVFVLDIEVNDPTEQAMVLLLQSRHFAAPSAVWGKIVADCVAYSKSRQTIQVKYAKEIYSRYCLENGQLSAPASEDLIKVEFGNFEVAVGREVVLGWLDVAENEADGHSNRRLVLAEFCRFDSDCNERIKFEGEKCILANGIEIEVIRRAATHAGMMRMIDREPALTKGATFTVLPIANDGDFEVGLCAETHRVKVRQAAFANQRPMHCLHCGRPVSSLTASLIEACGRNDLLVGLSHQECLVPEDRVLGTIQSKFFDEHPELVNFDPNAWFKAAQNGQRVFANAEQLGNDNTIIGWGGRRSSVDPGNYVVEMLLQGGGREIATVRNSVERFSKVEAEQFVRQLNQQITESKAKDQICYTDESKGFGPKSLLLQKFGGKERIIPVERARVRSYDERFAALYARPGSWYAPLFFLRSLDNGKPIKVLAAVVLLTNPTKFKNFLMNWHEAGLEIENYEIVSLLTDTQFDDFMSEIIAKGDSILVDPVLDATDSTILASGLQILSIEQIAAQKAREFG